MRFRSNSTIIDGNEPEADRALIERHPLLMSRLWDIGATGMFEDPGSGSGPPQLVVGFGDAASARQAVELARRWGLAGLAEPADDGWYANDVTSATVTTARGPVTFELTPGPTFGHGTHPTTALALEMMGQIPNIVGRPGTVLDLGCGSGVLAIAAHHLGARSITAIDIDPVAVTTTKANAVRNRVPLTCSTTTVAELAAAGRRYDTVLANVLVDVHEQVAGAVAAILTPRGSIITAGYLDHQRDRVTAAYRERRPAIRTVRTAYSGEWCGALLLDDVAASAGSQP